MRQLDINTIEVRERGDIEKLDGLIMPGGESTTLRKLLKNSGMWDAIKDSELPIMGTCAGAILLGKCENETFEKRSLPSTILIRIKNTKYLFVESKRVYFESK